MIGEQNYYITRLRESIQSKAGRKMKTPKDFDYLSKCIFETLHEQISPTTLKRLWGYLPENPTPRITTLNILAKYVGHENWDAFCRYNAIEVPVHDPLPQESAENNDISTDYPKPFLLRTTIVAIVLILVIGAVAWHYTSVPTTPQKHYILKKGQKFSTYHDYLKLFGIKDTTSYWSQVLPHHPGLILWGPEYQHPYWHNDGNPAQMMPTIIERWAPPHVDSAVIAMKNFDKYYYELRLNEVRITFMKNLVDSSYVFLGVYRMSLSQSDTTQLVWERIADDCDISNLNYLEELRN